jgi:glycosyltransferase involved in cell wall biosynthesis
MCDKAADNFVDRKRVAVVYHWFAHYRKPIMLALQEELSNDFEFTFIADTESLEPAMKVLVPGSNLESDDEIDVSWLHVRNRAMGPFIWQSGLLRQLLRGKFDSVILLGEFRILSSWIAVLLSRIMGSKAYFWSHGLYGNEGWLKKIVRLSFYRLAHGMFLYGHYSRRLLQESGFHADNLHVVFNSLDHAAQIQIRSSLTDLNQADFSNENFPGFSPAPTLILIGRLTVRKNTKLLLNALKILNERGVDVNTIIVGDGPEREDLVEQAKKFELRRIKFTGACHDEQQLASFVSGAALCVSPGDIGLLAMHSMVYGTPVVTHDDFAAHGPEFEAIIDGETGSFFEQGNAHSLAFEIEKWVSTDQSLKDKVRQNCYRMVDEFYNAQYQTRVFDAVLKGGTSCS